MLEVLMTKNENNSHAFLRKMVENIKLTKDAQCADDVKANEVITHVWSENGFMLQMIFHLMENDHGCCFYCCFMLQLQKLYIVCDVALFVIANKSTACHLDSPKEPVLPSKFFLLQDKAMHTWKILFKLMHRRYLNNSEIQVL